MDLRGLEPRRSRRTVAGLHAYAVKRWPHAVRADGQVYVRVGLLHGTEFEQADFEGHQDLIVADDDSVLLFDRPPVRRVSALL